MVQISLQNFGGKLVFLGRFHGKPSLAPSKTLCEKSSFFKDVRNDHFNSTSGTLLYESEKIRGSSHFAFPQFPFSFC